MKKYFISALFVLSLVISSNSAFAMQCKAGNYGSDECWTNVKISPIETTTVDKGTVLVYDFNAGTADDAAYTVRVASAVTDGYRIAGVAQKTIATGDSALVMVRGQGKIKVNGGVASGDRLFASAFKGITTVGASNDAASVASRDKAIAFAIQNSATTFATIDAFIVVV